MEENKRLYEIASCARDEIDSSVGHDLYSNMFKKEEIIRKACKEYLFYKQQRDKNKSFVEEFKKIQKDVHKTANDKGWWENERNDGELIALMHSELSETLEALRHNNPQDDKIPEFSGAEAELADVIIRIMDYAESRKFDIASAIIAKAEMNKKRKYKHGNKNF